METKNWIMIGLGILTFLGIYFAPKIWKMVKASKNRPSQTTISTPAQANTPAPTDHVTSKTKSKFFSKFFRTIGVILALAVTVALLFWAIGVVGGVIKKWNAPKPHYTTYTVQTVKTVRISNVSGMNIVYVPWKADARFKKATIAFCVENNLGEKVCGDAYSDPELSVGRTGEGQTLRFTPRDNPNQSGTIDVLITETKQRVDYY